MSVTVLYTPESSNRQTGNVPTAWIGTSIEEMRRTCEESGCAYFSGLKIGESVCRCYAWQGHARMALYSVLKAFRRDPERYDVRAALAKRAHSAKIMRFSSIGDPSAVGPVAALDIVQACYEYDVMLMGYVAGWRKARWWKGILRASVTSDADMQEALDLGWKTTRVAPMGTTAPPGGIGIMCPIKMGATCDCNGCRLCLHEKKHPSVIWFPDHTPTTKAHKALEARKAEANAAALALARG